MRLRFLFAVCLVCGSIAAEQDAPEPYVRFFNDSAKAVNFYVDGKFGCFIPENPKESNAWCDAGAALGTHRISIKGEKLHSQSCELRVTDRGLTGSGAEAILSKGELLHCFTFVTGD